MAKKDSKLKDFFDFSEEKRSYEGRNYKPSPIDILSTIVDSSFGPKGGSQLAEKLKLYNNGWQTLAEDVSNISVKFYDNKMEMIYHCVEKGFPHEQNFREEIQRKTSKFLSECEKVIKKDFKEAAGYTLKLKKIQKQDDHIFEQMDVATPWTSFVGSLPRTQANSYYIKTRRVYEIGNDE